MLEKISVRYMSHTLAEQEEEDMKWRDRQKYLAALP